MPQGIFIEIIDGKAKGKFGKVPYNKQSEQFIGKLYTHLFYDEQCTDPVINEGKEVETLIHVDFCKRIGLL